MKLNELNLIKEARRVIAEKVKIKINIALKNSHTVTLQKTQIIAVKRHSSDDLTLFISREQNAKRMIEHRETWQKALSKTATVRVSTYEIVIHEISTSIEISNKAEMKEKIQWNNSSLKKAKIIYSDWLKRDLRVQQTSSMMIEFDKKKDSDHAMNNEIVFEAQIFVCEFYDRFCKLKHCFRCQKCEHIETHCQAQETYEYCAKDHSTKHCIKRDTSDTKSLCVNCNEKHSIWSLQCNKRKKEFRKLAERRQSM